MSRTLTAGVAAEVVAPETAAAILVKFEFTSGDLNLWSGIGDLVFNSDTYTGTGTLGKVSAVDETATVRPTGMTFELSGIPAGMLSIALGEHYQGKPVTLWLGFFDTSDWSLVSDPVQLFAGKLDVMEVIEAGDDSSISVSAESRLVDFERPQEIRYYTDSDQQEEYAGDKFFEFVPELVEKVIVWGSKRYAQGAPGTTNDTGGTGGDGADGGGGGGGGVGGGGN